MADTHVVYVKNICQTSGMVAVTGIDLQCPCQKACKGSWPMGTLQMISSALPVPPNNCVSTLSKIPNTLQKARIWGSALKQSWRRPCGWSLVTTQARGL